MADNVQYILDRMAPTFKQMETLHVFSTDEIKSIIKKRTDYEYLLKRRQLHVSDVYPYLQYEINLDKLRALRSARAVKNKEKVIKTDVVEDTSTVISSKERTDALRNLGLAFNRHICFIFERVIRRFPTETTLWTDYIAYLKEQKSTSVLNTVFGRALALHPNNEDMWLQAAVHELDANSNTHAARTLLQRALRTNKHSKKLWQRYLELELWNAMKIVERQRILDIEEDNSALVDGAPVVIFKHALKAIPDFDFACHLHTTCLQISTELASKLEDELQARYEGDVRLWLYLSGAFVNNAKSTLVALKKLNEGGTDEAEEEREDEDDEDEDEDGDDDEDDEDEEEGKGNKKKRKLSDKKQSSKASRKKKSISSSAAGRRNTVVSLEDVLAISVSAIKDCFRLVDNARKKSIGDSNEEREIGYVGIMDRAVKFACGALSKLTKESLYATPQRHHLQPEGIMNEEGGESERVKDHTQEQLHANILELKITLGEVLCKILSDLDLSLEISKNVTGKRNQVMKLHAAKLQLSHRIWLLAASLGVGMPSESHGLLTSFDGLLDHIKQWSCKILPPAVTKNGLLFVKFNKSSLSLTHSSTSSAEQMEIKDLMASPDELIASWASLVQLSFTSASHYKGLAGGAFLDSSEGSSAKGVNGSRNDGKKKTSSSSKASSSASAKYGTLPAPAITNTTYEVGGESGPMIAAAKACLQAATYAVSCDAGVEVISESINILDTNGLKDEVISALKAIISSPHCLSSMRGQWCAMLVGGCILQHLDDDDINDSNSDNKGTSKKTHTDIDTGKKAGKENEMEKGVASLAEAFSWIESTLNSMPQYGANDLTPYYTSVIDAIMEIVNTQATSLSNTFPLTLTTNKKKHSFALDFALKAAEAAVNRCPQEDAYWDALEQVMRIRGDHKGANHIRWRRSRR